mgnify:CR=1 FL=1
MNKTKIEWCDFTWNPVVGCTGGCAYCYARKMAHRFHWDFTPHWVERNFQRAMPRKPSRIFVNSMSDVADWEPEWHGCVLACIHQHPEHLFLFLSKRPWQVPRYYDWPNIMLGYSATDQDDVQRLVNRVENVSFISFEPLHGQVRLWGKPPRWIIVGAETGNRSGRIVPKRVWLESIYEYARGNSTPLFFKDSLLAIWGQDNFPREYPATGGMCLKCKGERDA